MSEENRAPRAALPTGVRVLVAGGGTAGHVQPALAVADALTALEPSTVITCLGTSGGLENTLVPEHGYALELIPQVKFTRKLERGTLTIPIRLRGTVRAARAVLRARDIEVVIGFGGYVSLPAYLAARGRVPIVVHEANARPGIANRIGARFADVVVAAVADTGLKGARVVGNPVRRSLTGLDRAALRDEARATFGLRPDLATLVVIGGSSGAAHFNEVFTSVAPQLAAAGVQVLHVHGRGKTLPLADPGTGDDPGAAVPYVGVEYISRMDLAYAAADLLVTRSGAMTVAEIAAVRAPVVYVPLAFGNGEQALNARDQVAAGAAGLIPDGELTGDAVLTRILPLVIDPAALRTMELAASGSRTAHADEVLARIVLAAARKHRSRRNLDRDHAGRKHVGRKPRASR